ncbi:hypothetical protein Franean1_5407 [Parafrankia sp. EAN1pec]|uniref:hypothetical protein n=1 Tax=Parafrankia sp. (strain EAN1pec) TaxID=298653 RepID=UPI00005442EA|nr:hypothetical protein Franean1_5407 [Frankia sp. EAN1pec]
MISSSTRRRRGAAAVLAAAALATSAACTSSSPGATNATTTPSATTPSATATTATGGDVKAACAAELEINGTEFPGIDPDAPPATAQELQDFATKIGPLAKTLRAHLPAELTDEVDVLISVVNAAEQGTPIDYEGSGLNEAGQAVDAWMVENCGFPKLSVTNSAGTLTGLPASAPAGPVAITFTNTGDPAKAGFVLLLGKVKDGVAVTAADIAAGTADLETTTDIVTGVQPLAGQPGYGVTELPAGRYVVVSPLGAPPQFAGFATADLDVR